MSTVSPTRPLTDSNNQPPHPTTPNPRALSPTPTPFNWPTTPKPFHSSTNPNPSHPSTDPNPSHPPTDPQHPLTRQLTPTTHHPIHGPNRQAATPTGPQTPTPRPLRSGQDDLPPTRKLFCELEIYKDNHNKRHLKKRFPNKKH
ncbi:uncharacterized protein LOC134768970 [Penaeus indicus]|uniref:uncharacterized protein LOC134768970 n=1 Tax=Penaeus indicus TaxID=29960 RepID=UPI00300D822A